MSDELDLQKLLRLKRYEQPPPGYVDDFLREFHHRQRAALLREPLWRIGFERMAALFSMHSAGRYAYGAATALVLALATVASLHNYNTGSRQLGAQATERSGLALQSNVALPGIVPQFAPARATRSAHPHYVIDARPVSYEANFSF